MSFRSEERLLDNDAIIPSNPADCSRGCIYFQLRARANLASRVGARNAPRSARGTLARALHANHADACNLYASYLLRAQPRGRSALEIRERGRTSRRVRACPDRLGNGSGKPLMAKPI